MEVAGKDKNFNAGDAGRLWRSLEKIKTLTLRTLASYGGRWKDEYFGAEDDGRLWRSLTQRRNEEGQ